MTESDFEFDEGHEHLPLLGKGTLPSYPRNIDQIRDQVPLLLTTGAYRADFYSVRLSG